MPSPGVSTLVFSDLKGSTALAERLDPETLRAVLARYFDEMRIVLESHGGSIAKIIGDAIVTIFDDPDDPSGAARRATRAAVESQVALEWLNEHFERMWGERLQTRTGIATGQVSTTVLQASTAGEVLAGEVVSRAEALESAAPVMEILVDDNTRRLLADDARLDEHGPVAGTDGNEEIDAWLVVNVRAPRADGGPERATGAMRLCESCDLANEPDVRRCARCGAALATGDTSRESRRMVTILFADPSPSGTGVKMSDELVRTVMSRYFDVMRPVIELHGATVEKFIGDAIMAVFGLPVRHEDDALRALRAASEMQTALRTLNAELVAEFGVTIENPIGINTGTVVAGDALAAERLVTGDAVNVAARFEQSAGAGDIVLGELTRRLAGDAVVVEPLPPLHLKGKADPVAAFRLVEVAGISPPTRRHELPLVGRVAEMDELRRAYRSATDDAAGRRVTVIGDAGVGKSRLVHEFLAEIGGKARVLRGNCLSYGDGITFWALLGVVQEATGIGEDDDADVARSRIGSMVGDEPDLCRRLESLAGLDETPFPVAELVWAMRRLLERMATERPVLVLIEDVHWAEPTFIEAIEQLDTTVEGAVMVLCTARTLVNDRYPEFVAASPSVVLAPLTDEQCEHFLRLLLGAAELDAAGMARIVRAAGGNPLFIEQFLSMLIDDGRLQQVDGRWRTVGDLGDLAVPASIEALLTARIDRLEPRTRQVIEPASVAGRDFVQDAVTQLVERDVVADVPAQLSVLTERDLLQLIDDEVEPAYRFQHQLIRDATYNGLLKEARAILHERFVRWADSRYGGMERATELEEIMGYHLEQAHRYWVELGPLDPHVVAIGQDASRRLASAGERALARGDVHAAANLLLRAAALVDGASTERARVLLLAGAALHETGSFDRAIAAYEDAGEASVAAGDDALAIASSIEHTRLRYLSGRIENSGEVGELASDAIARLDGLGNRDALARAWQLQLNVDIAGCRWDAAHRSATKVIDLARSAGNSILEVRTMPLLGFLAQKGPTPVREATRTCTEILRRVEFDRRSSASTRLELAVLSAMDLEADSGRSWCEDARRVLAELGWEMQAALVSLSSGPLELLADEPARAEIELRRDFDALQALEERNFISLTAALLAESLYRQGQYDEATELVEYSGGLAAADDLAVHIVLDSVGGRLDARDGDTAGGVARVRRALASIDATPDPSGQGDLLLDLADVLMVAGDRDGARRAASESLGRYEAKGNRAGMRRAERIAASVDAGRDPLDAAGR